MLLHAINQWPNMLSIHLWPYAFRHANEVFNTLPYHQDGASPLERFNNVAVSPKIRHFNAFGCPAYVLDNKLQGNQSLPKWQQRARLGIYLGPSPNHSRSIGLILNPRTGHGSPQFHVKYDNFFETVRKSNKDNHWDAPKPLWLSLAQFDKDKTKTITGHEISTRNIWDLNSSSLSRRTLQQPPMPTQPQTNSEDFFPSEESTNTMDNPTLVQPAEQEMPLENEGAQHNEHEIQPQDTQLPQEQPIPIQQTRSGRTIKPTQRFLESTQQKQSGIVAWEVLLDQDSSEKIPTAKEQYQLQQYYENPIAFAAAGHDVLRFREALKASDRNKFLEAMDQEIGSHDERQNWKVIPLSQVPKGTKLIDTVWTFARKRKLDTREIYKWKARLTVHGGQQIHGINFWDTYAPVVMWPTIRFFFCITLLRQWHTRQVDFIMAYPHAPVETPLYLRIPQGFDPRRGSRKTHALQLLRNVYGQKQAGRVWNQFLDAALIKIGFISSDIDPCLYFKQGIVLVVYIDDCILFSPNNSLIDETIKKLCDAKFNIEDQGTVNDFLGIKVERFPDGTIRLTQPNLIESILQDLGLQNTEKGRETPALSTKILTKDESGPEMNDEFHYRSVIGKLNFLEKSTRPDLAYSVHQCARFSSNPKRSHAEAVKKIGRYLVSTRDKCIFMKPQEDHSFDCWVDANFAGDWNQSTALSDPMTSKSRSGWVISYANCPITWSSKLQTLTALSTTEAEYVALSMALREQIPLMGLLKECNRHKLDIHWNVPTIHCKVFEDNSGALVMARLPKVRPRTKHLNNVYHHFRQHVENQEISIHSIDTDHQIADIFTKPLEEILFKKFRKQIMGW